jgi:hypothetical protein
MGRRRRNQARQLEAQPILSRAVVLSPAFDRFGAGSQRSFPRPELNFTELTKEQAAAAVCVVSLTAFETRARRASGLARERDAPAGWACG